MPQLLDNMPEQLSHAQLARLLWTTKFPLIMACELRQFSHVSKALFELYDSVRASTQGELQLDRGAMLRLTSTTAALARERSWRILPFSVVARSLSYLMQRVPVRVWAVERLHRCVLAAAPIILYAHLTLPYLTVP